MKGIIDLRLVLVACLLIYTSSFAGSGAWDGTVTYDAGGGEVSQVGSTFNSQNLGVVSQLILKGGSLKTWKDGTNVTGAKMYYSVYLQGNSPNFNSTIDFPWMQDLGTNGNSLDQLWGTTSGITDVTSGLSPGQYYLEVYFVAYTDTEGDKYDSNSNGENYKATFTISPPPPTLPITFDSDTDIIFTTDADNSDPNAQNKFVMLENGTMGIGTTKTGGYRLAVEGTIAAREVIVTAEAFPDYVFGDDYKLMTLQELEQYIKQNKHLPNISPASKIESEGMPMGEIQIKLVEKVEELTLYIIEQNKKSEKLTEQLILQDQRIKELEGLLEKN